MSAGSSGATASTSRAGRDLPAAIAVSIALIAVVVASLVYVKAGFVVVVAAAVLVALWELGRALALSDTWLPVPPMAAGALAMIAGSYYGGADVLVATLAATVLVSLLWRMPRGQIGFVKDVTAAAFCLVYVPFLASFVALLLAPHDGVRRVLTFFAVTAASDIGGYCIGVFAGRHPLAPVISPKKSWEGFAGSTVFCVAVGVVCVVFWLDGGVLVGVLLGAAVAVAATLGDLVESLIKRDLGIKDMSNILPGHGGIMDRLDSLLAAVPIVYLVLHFLVPGS